jgi:hypothetical protein
MHICDYTESLQAKQLDESIDQYRRINRHDDFVFGFGRYRRHDPLPDQRVAETNMLKRSPERPLFSLLSAGFARANARTGFHGQNRHVRTHSTVLQPRAEQPGMVRELCSRFPLLAHPRARTPTVFPAFRCLLGPTQREESVMSHENVLAYGPLSFANAAVAS